MGAARAVKPRAGFIQFLSRRPMEGRVAAAAASDVLLLLLVLLQTVSSLFVCVWPRRLPDLLRPFQKNLHKRPREPTWAGRRNLLDNLPPPPPTDTSSPPPPLSLLVYLARSPKSRCVLLNRLVPNTNAYSERPRHVFQPRPNKKKGVCSSIFTRVKGIATFQYLRFVRKRDLRKSTGNDTRGINGSVLQSGWWTCHRSEYGFVPRPAYWAMPLQIYENITSYQTGFNWA